MVRAFEIDEGQIVKISCEVISLVSKSGNSKLEILYGLKLSVYSWRRCLREHGVVIDNESQLDDSFLRMIAKSEEDEV